MVGLARSSGRGTHASLSIFLCKHLWERVRDHLSNNKRGTERPSAKHPSLLAGQLETSDGQRLIPSHAVKRGRRYRYYIEQRLVRDEGVGTKGARYAAEEVEKAVLAILRRFLNSPAEITAALAIGKHSPGSMKTLVGQAKTLSDDLNDRREAHHIIPEVIDKVIIDRDKLELRLRRHRLARLLGTETRSEDPIHVVTSPCKLARRGQELKFILPLLEDSSRFSRQDPALIQAVAKAHLWWDWVNKGEVKSLTEIARREGIDKPKVTRLLRLAFLSPRLVRRILEGEQPVGVTVKTLTREHDLPRLWQEQEALVACFR